MKNRSILIIVQLTCFVALLLTNAHGQNRTDVTDILQFTHETIKINGYIGERFDLAFKNRILAQDVDHLILPFRNRTETTCWQTEFWGKWLTSALQAYRYHPEPELKELLDKAVSGLISTQTDDGYIGNYDSKHRLQQWDIWGRKYSLLGLIGYYEITRNKKSLEAARKLTDHLIHELDSTGGLIINKGNYRGMAASSILEPVCLLYNATRDNKYLDFAKEIVRQWELPEGPQLLSKSAVDVSKRFGRPTNWFGWEQGQKAYEMMSCYEGLLELYRITGDESYIKTVEEVWQNIYDNEINVVGSGSAAEMWFGGKELQSHPIYKYQETCVTVTWLKLTHQLLRLTGKSKYADVGERVLYNSLLGSMSPGGTRWTKYTPLIGQRLPGSGQCGMDLNCCDASGPRGLFNVPGHIIMNDKNGIVVNYYIAGTYETNTPQGQPIKITQETQYPREGIITIKFEMKQTEHFALNVRIPQWSHSSDVRVNGREYVNDNGKGYVSIVREWQEGDKIELQLDMRGRLVEVGEPFAYSAITRGPIVLAMDQRLAGPNFSKILKPIIDGDNFVHLRPAKAGYGDIWMCFEVSFAPEVYLEGGEAAASPISIKLCDYASAGYGETYPIYKVWFPQLIDPKKF